MVDEKSAPPRIAGLLSHPIRWAIIRELAACDRTVQELVYAIGVPQNLVSYHLAILRRGGLVSEHRSAADRRDIYYSPELAVVGEQLEGVALALHPVLSRRVGKYSPHGAVLFLCSGNSARSLMAEALVRHLTHGRLDAASAGTRPAGVHALTFKTLDGLGVPSRALRSKHWSVFSGRRFDRVVTLCDVARDELPEKLFGRTLIHWSIADPAAVKGSAMKRAAAFIAAANAIQERIPAMLASMAA